MPPPCVCACVPGNVLVLIATALIAKCKPQFAQINILYGMQRCSDAALVIAIADGEDVDDDHGDNNSGGGGDGDGWTTTTTGVVGGGMTTHPAGWIGWPIRAAAGAYCMRTLATGLPVVCDPKPGDNESRTNYACANVADAPHKHTHSHTHPAVVQRPGGPAANAYRSDRRRGLVVALPGRVWFMRLHYVHNSLLVRSE